LKYLFIFLLFIGSSQANINDDIQIIASNSCKINHLNKLTIKEIFLKKREYIAGEQIIILDNPNEIIYKNFIHKFINKNLREIKVYWMRMLFTGQTIPPEKLKPTSLNLYDDKICYISYINKTIALLKWKEIKVE